jgi:hypothetical protein
MIISSANNVNHYPSRIFINNNNLGQNEPNLTRELLRVRSTDAVPAIKYLGVHFDPSLTFKHHVNHVSYKISRALFLLCRVKNILTPSLIRTLYFSLIQCHLSYAIEIWSQTPATNLNELFVKQKNAIRIIANSKYNSHTAPLFKQLSILPLDSLVQMSLLKIMNHYTTAKLPPSFQDTWSTVRASHEATGSQTLRNEDDFRVPFARTNYLQRFPLVKAPTLCNDLPNDLRIITTVTLFSNSIKTFLLNKLPDRPICTRLFCPVCSNPV